MCFPLVVLLLRWPHEVVYAALLRVAGAQPRWRFRGWIWPDVTEPEGGRRARVVAALLAPVVLYTIAIAVPAIVYFLVAGEQRIETGNEVERIIPGSPAAGAGLRSGDGILDVAGARV